MKIPICLPTLSGREWSYLKKCLEINWISSKGKFIEEFEKGFADYLGVKYATTTTSATTAIHLALVCLGINKGDEVIVPSLTMVGSVFPIIYCGAKPILVDSEPETWNIDASKIEEKISPRTKAIIIVHLYGHPCHMEPIIKIAKKHKLYLIEDAAEAHGAEYQGRKIGSFGDISCFSFYANKIITTGEGGILLTNHKKIYERAKLLKDMAFIQRKRFLHYQIGFNYRMTNLQAAIGLAQFEKINQYVKARRNNAKLYNQLLKDVKGITLPPEKDWAKNVYWMYALLVNEKQFGFSRDGLMKKLAKKGIETRSFFIPMHQQPVFRKIGLFKQERYSVAERLSREGILLPSSSSLTEKEIKYICQMIKRL